MCRGTGPLNWTLVGGEFLQQNFDYFIILWIGTRNAGKKILPQQRPFPASWWTSWGISPGLGKIWPFSSRTSSCSPWRRLYASSGSPPADRRSGRGLCPTYCPARPLSARWGGWIGLKSRRSLARRPFAWSRCTRRDWTHRGFWRVAAGRARGLERRENVD